MPINRESSDTIEIGRDYEYGPNYSDRRPLRRSSTSRSDEWVYYDRTPGQRGYYDDYRPLHKGPEVYDRPKRPESYQDDFYHDRWQRNLSSATHRRGAQNQAVSLRPRPRSPSPVGYYDERVVIANKSERVASETAPHHDFAAPPKRRRRNSEPIPGLYQTVFDVNHPQDTSVHLELPITDDYETELEEFCRLQRLGNFGAAEDYFKKNLEQHLSNPYVFVQYGQMLLEKGDYLAFERLDAEAVFGKDDRPRSPPREEIVVAERTRSPPPRVRPRSRSRSWSPPRERRRTIVIPRSPSPVANDRQDRHARFEPDVRIVRRSRSPAVDRPRHDFYSRDRDDEMDRGRSPDRAAQLKETIAEPDYDELQLLRQNWRLMKSVCDIHGKGNYEDALDEAWYTIDNFQFGAGIGSTEIQLARLALQLCAHIDRVAPERYSSGLDEAARTWIEWPTLSKELLAQGRIWDFKDLYVATLAAFSNPEATPYFGTEDDKRSLVDDWISEEGDESTNLALLDILLEPTQLRSVFPHEIKSRVEAIITHCPIAMKSRSFIRWILASAADAIAGDTKDEDGLWLTYKTRTNGFPGIVWHRPDCFLPGVYVPPNTQNPGWVPPEPSLAVEEPIQLALNLAKELKDYKSQVACLKLLIIQSEDPTALFQDLASLQKSSQGDKEGHLETMLSSYLVCKDRSSKEKLLEELQQTEDWRDDMLRDGILYWSRDFIERALKRSLQGPKSTAKLRNPPGFYIGKGLPKEVEQFTWQNTEHNDFPHATVHPQYPSGRRDTARCSEYLNQTHSQQVTKPYSKPPKPYERILRSSRTRSKTPHNAYGDESFSQREREELEAVRDARRRELERTRENEERERRDWQDREMRLRLEDAEQRGRRQEEINKIQAEQMAKKTAELEKLEEGYKLARAKQDREAQARAQQDRETRERLERTEVALRDQGDRLRRAEDRPYQEWLADRDRRLTERTRWRKNRSRRKRSVETMSLMSSQTYSSDSSGSSDDEDSDHDVRRRRTDRKDSMTSSHNEDGSDHETRDNGRRRGSVARDDPRRDEANRQHGDDIGNLQQNPCTDVVLYRGAQITISSDGLVAESSLPRSLTPPLQNPEEVDGPTNTLTAETPRRVSQTSHTRKQSFGSKKCHHGTRKQSKKREVEDKHKSALAYPQNFGGPPSSLPATGVQRINRPSSRSTKDSERKRQSDSRRPSASKNSLDPDDVTLFVKGSGFLTVGNTQLAIKDGEEITICTKGRDKGLHSSIDNASLHLKGEVNGSTKNSNPTTNHNTTTEAVPSSSPTAQPLSREQLDDLYESVRSIGVEDGETQAQRLARREREEFNDLEYGERGGDRLDTHDRKSSLAVPLRRSTTEEASRRYVEARPERPRGHLVRSFSKADFRFGVMLMQEQKSTTEDPQTYTQDKAGQLTQQPQVINEFGQSCYDVDVSWAGNEECIRSHRRYGPEPQNYDGLSSKQQNERIANRPSRPSSIGIYGSPRPYIYDSTGLYDAWEESPGKRTPRSTSRVFVEPPPNSANTPRISARARSRPSSMQEPDDIHPVVRRTSRLDYPTPLSPPPVERLQSPTKRQSLIIDADGRPQPIRTKSESLRSRSGDAGSGPYIVVRRGVSADGRRPTAEMPAAAARSRSRPQSMMDPVTRHHHPGPEPGVTERLRAESWERETEGVWKKKPAVSTLHEDPEEGDEQKLPPPPPRTNEGESSKQQNLLDPEQGISRKSTVTDPGPEEE